MGAGLVAALACACADIAHDFGLDGDPPGSVDMNRLLEDDHVTGGQWIGEDDMQAFLESKGSGLAGYSDPTTGESAASILVERSKEQGLNPVYTLARVQTESSLITSGGLDNVDQATGCACPDGAGCSEEQAGFARQVACSAEWFRGYLDDLEAGEPTVAGWQVGVGKETMDPCWVVPENMATAALYTYTPWAGAYAEQCGTGQWGGSSLVAISFHRFAREWEW